MSRMSVKNYQFDKSELVFFGIKLTKGGIAPTDDRVKLLKELPFPQDAQTLHSFLGLAVLMSTHIPNFATIAAPFASSPIFAVIWYQGPLARF